MAAEPSKNPPSLTSPRSGLSTAVEATGSVLITCAVLAVVCRTYVRFLRKRTAGLDDVCVLLAAGLTIASGVAQFKFTRSGLGEHMRQLPKHAVGYTLKWFVIGTFESYVCLFFIRASVGIFILRMLSPQQLGCRVAVWAGMFLNLAVTVTVLTVASVWCRPLHGLWDKTVPAKCISAKIVGHANMTSYAISAAIDIFFASLPICVCWNLKMDRKLKRNLSIIMLLSLATCICAIGKAISVKDITPDFTYSDVPVTFWAIFEVNIGIIVSSLPALRQFYTVSCADILRLMGRSARGQDDEEQSVFPSSDGSSRKWPSTSSRQTFRTFHGSKSSIASESFKSPSRSTWRTLDTRIEELELEPQYGITQ